MKISSQQYIVLIFILRHIVHGRLSEYKTKQKLDPVMVEHVLNIVDEIERYTNTVPNMFSVIRRSLSNLERQLKVATMLPAQSDLESFRLVCNPFNDFLKQEPKDYLIHNPPRGSVYNGQLRDTKNKIRKLYNKLQMLWLDHY